MSRLPRLLLALVTGALLASAFPAVAPAAGVQAEPHEVVVAFAPGSTAHTAQVAGTAPAVLKVKDVRSALRGLRARPDVRYAVPNVKAHISQAAPAPFIPNDPGREGGTAGAWAALQWNFTGEFGVHAPEAWANAIAARRPGARGVTIAVLDTGVAYSNRPPYKMSPDFGFAEFKKGWDFVDRDPYPFDKNGHGTHVAGTLAEATNNGYGVTGLAYGARLMPVRVLDSAGEGNATDIAAGIRFAAKRGAQVINLSLEFDAGVTAGDIPQLLDAIRYARSAGSLVVAASGNEGRAKVAYPARATGVLSVGATTEHGCLSAFSNGGRGLDIVAPGGGEDAALPGDVHCVAGRPGRTIFQVTLDGDGLNTFGIPSTYEGTSMAVPHVAATAALIIATGTAGPDPTPAAVERRLEQTATDLGRPGYDTDYGYGLVNAAAATTPLGTATPAPTPTPVPAPTPATGATPAP